MKLSTLNYQRSTNIQRPTANEGTDRFTTQLIVDSLLISDSCKLIVQTESSQ
jgi:hypothetical protein